MENIDYDALFGMPLGVNVQEPADPAAADDASGEKAQELADPADENIKETAERQDAADEGILRLAPHNDSVSSEAEVGGNSLGEQGQSKDDNARFASARRKAEAERDEAIANAKAEQDRIVAEILGTLGIVDQEGQAVKTADAWDRYRAQIEAENAERIKQNAGLSDEEYKSFVESIPEVREARAAKERIEREQREIHEQKVRQDVDEQLKQIGALDPDIKSLEDLTKTDTYPQLYELVKKGNSVLDAFKLANFERLSATRAQASRQAAYNSISSKQHLSATATRGSGAVAVPEDVKSQYRLMNPDMTDAEIQRHYNYFIKRTKGV